MYVAAILLLLAAAPTREIALEPTSITSNGGRAYMVAVPHRSFPYDVHSDDINDGLRSRLKLYEDGVQLGSPHTAHVSIRGHGYGAFSHWSGSLVFSSSDNTDPRTNGRRYTAAVPLSLYAPLLWSALPLLILLLLELARRLGQVAKTSGRNGAKFADDHTGLRETSLSWPAVPLLVPLGLAVLASIILFAVVPPIYTDLTIARAVKTPSFMLPHYPPLYAYFLWATHTLANAACGLPAGLSDCGLYAMTILQHLIFAAAVCYFALGCSDRLLGRVAAIVPFYLMAAFLLVNHGLQTEAIWFSCLALMFGATIRILRSGAVTPATLVTLCGAFTAGLLIRPTTLFLAPIVPGALILASLAERSRRSLANLALVALVLSVGAVVSLIATAMAFAAHGIEYRSPWGRGTIEVVQVIVSQLEAGADGIAPVQRTALIPTLQARADDPLLRNAIPTIVAYVDATYDGTGKYTAWGGAHYALMRSGTRDAAGIPVAVDLATADRLVNSFCLLFIRTYPDLVADYAITNAAAYARDALGMTGGSGLQITMEAKLEALRLVTGEWEEGVLPGVRSLAMVRRNADVLTGYQRLFDSSVLGWAAGVSDLQWAGVLGLLLGAGILTRRHSRPVALFMLAGAATGVFCIGVTSVLLIHLKRYELPYEFLLAAMLGAAAAGLATPREAVQSGKRFEMRILLPWVRGLLLLVTVFIPGFLAAAWIARPTLTAEIGREQVQPAGGLAYNVSIDLEPDFPSAILYANFSDDASNPARSTLALREDNMALGPAHIPHEQIITRGGGSFSHWNGSVTFSSSDNTDARTNGRTYVIQATAQLRNGVISCGLALFLACASGMYLLCGRNSKDRLPFHIVMLNAALLLACLDALDMYSISDFYPLLSWDSLSFLAGSAFRGFLYTAFLNVSIWLAPSGRLLVPLQLSIMFLSFAALGWSVGRLTRNGLLGWLIVLLLLADTGLTRFALLVLSEPVFIALVAFHFAAVFSMLRRVSMAAGIFAGLTAGLTILVRPAGYSLLLTIPFIVAVVPRGRLQVALQTALPAGALLMLGTVVNFATSGSMTTQSIGGLSLLGHVLHLGKPEAKSPHPELYRQIVEATAPAVTSAHADYPLEYWQATTSEYNKLLWGIAVPRVAAYVQEQARQRGEQGKLGDGNIVEDNVLATRVDENQHGPCCGNNRE